MNLGTRGKAVCFILIFLLLFVTACSTKGTTESTATNQPTTESTSTATNQPTEKATDPFGKYDPPIEITTVRIVNDTVKYAQGETIENNVWTKKNLETLGIKVKNLWVVSGDAPGGQGEQKMNVSIASGNLPQFIPVNAKQLKQLVDADMLMDLTSVYDQYAAPFTKEVITQDGPNALLSATFKGKLMAIPNTGSVMDGAPMVWVRTDWLKKLSLPEPTTMSDVLKIADAFTNLDPDGNNKKDSVGLALNKDLYGGYGTLDGFFNSYHAYPQIWIKDAAGTLVNGSIQPEMKTALAKLQEMYKSGQIDREFGVKDTGKAAEAASSGKNGLNFGQMWNPLYPLNASKDLDKNAEWKSFPLASIDDKPAMAQVTLSVGQYFAVLKDTKNPEALLKMINLFIESGWGKTATPEVYASLFTSEGIERFKYTPFQAWPARKNLDIHLHVSAALDSKDTSKLGAEEKDMYDKITKYLDGKGGSLEWAYERIFGKAGSFVTIDKYVNDKLLMNNEFYAAPTPTMVEKGSTLQKMELEVFTKIIMGSPLSDFDKFVSDYKKLGGDQITKEINDWYKAK
jgi:putative aldouronate transport system substrate-binding protein